MCSLLSSSSSANHAVPAQCGATTMADAPVCRNICATRGSSEGGGCAHKRSPAQGCAKASVPEAPAISPGVQ